MRKIIQIVLLIFCMSTSAFSQFSVGPKIGLGLSIFRDTKMVSPTGGPIQFTGAPVYKAIVTPQVGVIFNWDMGKFFSLRPELLYTQKGFTASSTVYGSPFTSTCRLSYIEVPIHLILSGAIGSGHIEVLAGPALSYGIAGKQKLESNGNSQDITVKFGKVPDRYIPSNEIYYNPFNASLDFGFGYRLKGLIVQFNYNLGLTNIRPHYEKSDFESKRNDNYITKASSFQLSVGYIFEKKKK
jgi:hypothetical protein